MQGTIKNIIFDLGGVLLNIDYDAPVRKFKELGIPDFQKMYSQAQQSNLFDDFETGKISNEKFRDAIRDFAGIALSDAQIDQAWNSILLDMPVERIEFLRSLKKDFRLFMLSNTNAIHIRSFEADLIKVFGHNVFEEIFEKVHYSSELGMRKPHQETFEKVLGLHGLSPAETLFIDDSQQHVNGAKAVGINARWLDVKNEDIVSFFKKMN